MTRPAGAPGVDSVPGRAVRPRPALHFAPSRNWMNDPNGLIQWNGRIHLFYQHNPRGLTLEHMAWGHASSTDLWNWADHPLALEPGGAGPDRDGCWSGCAVVHDGTPYLLYTGLRGQVTLPCLATADDQDLISWSRSGQNPVIAGWPPEPGILAFRDHTAWRAGSAWYQVIGGGLTDRGGALFLYRSEDLRNWQYLGVFAAAADHGLPGQIWECPDVFTLGQTTVVIVSLLSPGPGGAIWMTGEITGDRFTPRASGPCDGGDRYYAPQSSSLADGRRIGIGWLRESLDELTGRDRTRVGVMSLPRELYLENTRLRSRPARELDGARGEKLATQIIQDYGAVNVKLSAREQSAAEFGVTPVRGQVGVIVLRLQGTDCDDVEIQVRPGHIAIREGTQLLTSKIPAAAADTPPALVTGPVRVYYDAGILEVYSPSADPAAVICNRDARYGGIGVQIPALPGAPPSAVSITGWSSGRPPPTPSRPSWRAQRDTHRRFEVAMPWQNSTVTSDQDGNGLGGAGRRAPTLADVARDARVSKTTAALVLRESSPRNISAPTQDRVRAAARRLGYVRNQAGRELRSRTNTTLGFIADGIAEGPFAGEMIRGAQDAAWHRGYLLMIVETGHDDDLICEAVTRFTERRVRRIIYAAYAHRQVDLPPSLADANPVLANAFDAERKYSSFVPDEFGGGLLAAQTLLAIRRAPVGFINIARGDPAATGRLNGYRAAVESAGLPFDESLVIHTGIHAGGSADRPGKGGGNAVDGYKAARVLFRRHPDLSLLFCGTDRMAMGAYDYLKETGRRIPQDVAVVGFDNQWLVATQIRPTLTTIALPHYDMGKRAVQLALGHADGEARPEQVALPCRLVARKST